MDDLTQTAPSQLDPNSWVGQYGDYLYRFAISRLRDSHAAEEVLQETFIAALRHADQYESRGSERAWLLGILKRKIIDFIRSRNRAQTRDEHDSTDPTDLLFDKKGHWRPDVRRSGFAPVDSLEQEDFWRILRACLELLPTRHADVFTLRELEDWSTEEICKELGITSSNLWVILYRARIQLSQCMKNRLPQD